MKDGRRFGGPPKPYQPPSTPQGEVNLTDPDARVMKAFRGYVQGYNLQAAVNEQHIVLAAEITVESVDFAARPMVDATLRELEQRASHFLCKRCSECNCEFLLCQYVTVNLRCHLGGVGDAVAEVDAEGREG